MTDSFWTLPYPEAFDFLQFLTKSMVLSEDIVKQHNNGEK
jgi:hypothetical protein